MNDEQIRKILAAAEDVIDGLRPQDRNFGVVIERERILAGKAEAIRDLCLHVLAGQCDLADRLAFAQQKIAAMEKRLEPLEQMEAVLILANIKASSRLSAKLQGFNDAVALIRTPAATAKGER